MRAAVRTTESYPPSEDRHDEAVLHEEINRLPESLRSVVTLCYLEGLTYEGAAHRLGVSETTVRGRLARARERLRVRLTARDVSVPTGVLIAGTAGRTQAAISTSLVDSTVRIALGFVAGKTASVLARGVLNTMLLNRLKVVMALFLLGIGSSVQVWHAFAAATDEDGQTSLKQVNGTIHASAPVSAPKAGAPVSARKGWSTGLRAKGWTEPNRRHVSAERCRARR